MSSAGEPWPRGRRMYGNSRRMLDGSGISGEKSPALSLQTNNSGQGILLLTLINFYTSMDKWISVGWNYWSKCFQTSTVQLFKFVEIRRSSSKGWFVRCVSRGLINLVKQVITGEQLLWGCFCGRIIVMSYRGINKDIMSVFLHDDVIKGKYIPRYWPFVRGIHQSPDRWIPRTKASDAEL